MMDELRNPSASYLLPLLLVALAFAWPSGVSWTLSSSQLRGSHVLLEQELGGRMSPRLAPGCSRHPLMHHPHPTLDFSVFPWAVPPQFPPVLQTTSKAPLPGPGSVSPPCSVTLGTL